MASLTSDKVSTNIFNVPIKNPQLTFPFPKDAMLNVGRELYGNDNISKMIKSIFERLIKTIPNDIESLDEKQFFNYFLACAVMGVPVKPKQEIIRILWKYPEAAKWIIEAFNENIEKLEEESENTKKARDDIRNFKSKNETRDKS